MVTSGVVWVGMGRFILAVGTGEITLERTERGWDAITRLRGDAPCWIGRDLPLEYAQGVAEDQARRIGASTLVNPNAAWRRRPATGKQLAVLRYRGMRIGRRLSAGEASDLLTAGRGERAGWRRSR